MLADAPLTITEPELALMQALAAAPSGTPVCLLPLAPGPARRGPAGRRLRE